jgi:hypothetical protein
MDLRHKLKYLPLLLLISFSSNAAVEVGEVSYARGLLTGQVDGQSPRIISKGVTLHNGETLNTGSRGFAVIKLDDGTKMTLRPNTTFKIEDVNVKAGQENAFMSLIRGGFRAITGLISKSNPDAFRINTSVATIGIRGTEFDARLCDGDECQQENKATGKKGENESTVIGRIAVLKGRASATESDNSNRVLNVGAAVYERDKIQTGINSFTVIAFNDKSRVTMSPNSAFEIEEHRYSPKKPDENKSFFSFLKGGLRLVSGLVGKLNKKAFRLNTPTATIGIRGTGFDLICDGACVNQGSSLNPVQETVISRLLNYFVRPVWAQSSKSGMYASVWNGAIELQFGNGKLLLQKGKVAFLANKNARPILIPKLPIHIRNMGGAPRPDQVDVPKDLFSSVDQKNIKPGLYVNVRKGEVEVKGSDGSKTRLGHGEASTTSVKGATIRLSYVPPFQKFDKVPDPKKVDAKTVNLINLFGDDDGSEKKEFECTIQ